MSKQDIIIGNQKEIMKNINDIKEMLNSHDKQLDMLTLDNITKFLRGVECVDKRQA